MPGTPPGALRAPTGASAIGFSALPAPVHGLAGALCISGLAELVLQRLVYRIGVHIPREDALLFAYQASTAAGELAFRLTAVLLAAVAIAVVLVLREQRGHQVLGAALAVLVAFNLAVWPLGFTSAAPAAALLIIITAGWLAGTALAGQTSLALRAAIGMAAGAVLLGQYRLLLMHFEVEGPQFGVLQWLAEAGLILAAGLFALAASSQRGRRRAALLTAPLVLILVAAYGREPSTLAVMALWSSGVTLSLPPVFYLAASAAGFYAVFVWLGNRQTRHLGLGMVLLFVAGLQPQVVHHGLTACLGLILLALSAEPARATANVSFEPPAVTEVSDNGA